MSTNPDEAYYEPYFEWLYAQINPVRQKNPARTYWKLFRILHAKEFRWFIPNDDNRAADGTDLRREWIDHGDAPRDIDPDWLNMGCSFLELLVGLSRRAAFLTSEDPSEWFWRLLEHLNLRQYNDLHPIPKQEVDRTLDRVISRTYSKTGRGGLFPLSKARQDQRGVELWYQLQAYVMEKFF